MYGADRAGASGVLTFGHVCRQGAAAPPAALGADSTAALLSVELHVMAACWSSHAMAGKASGARGDHTPLPTA